MKRALACISFAGLLMTTAVAAAPMNGGGQISASYSGAGITNRVVPTGNDRRKHEAIVQLAEEGRALQTADGGTLTPEHHAYLQAKYEAILAGNY